MPMPKRLYVPLQQHVGAAAEPEVEVGQYVFKGQLLAHSQGNISAPVHAPTSGTIIAIGEYPAPHPSGLPVKTITLEADGKDCWINLVIPEEPFSLEPAEISARVGAAGVVGMGGATFPAAVKLRLGIKSDIHTFIVNGGECEPYLTCDDRLMREYSNELIDGIRIVMRALQPQKTYIAIEDNKPEAIAILTEACKSYENIQVVPVPAQYPMGSAQHMITTITGVEVPADGRSADVGVLVHNVGTVVAIHRAVRHGQPLISRIVTVGGGALNEPQNIEVPIGALLSDVIKFCGGYKQKPARLIMGGPMMGLVMPHADVPVVKGTSGIIALTLEEITPKPIMPCIRCASCVDACPSGLVPLEMAANIRSGELEGAVKFGLVDCIACGCCAYVCPSQIPLVQYFNYAKDELAAQQRAKHKAEETRKLVETRKQRLEAEAAARAAAAAARKAAKAKKTNSEMSA
jgi:electron transport complex protein RnfC